MMKGDTNVGEKLDIAWAWWMIATYMHPYLVESTIVAIIVLSLELLQEDPEIWVF